MIQSILRALLILAAFAIALIAGAILLGPGVS